nr:hypothetical protein BaRGS_011252 [Batillaria attramentaria]
MAPKLPQKLAKRKLSAAAVSNGTESKLAQACLAPVLSHAAGDPDLNLQQTEGIPLPAAVDRVNAAEEEAAAVDDDAEEITERTPKLDRSKGLTLKCRYCGSINTEKQLNENKQLYDPHLKRHLPGSPDRKEPTGMAARSGRCIFCYAEFPKASGLASCDAEVGGQMYHGTLGLEANKVTLKLRKKCVDDPESSLRYRVLLRSVGLLTSIMGKVSDKASKTFNPIC